MPSDVHSQRRCEPQVPIPKESGKITRKNKTHPAPLPHARQRHIPQHPVRAQSQLLCHVTQRSAMIGLEKSTKSLNDCNLFESCPSPSPTIPWSPTHSWTCSLIPGCTSIYGLGCTKGIKFGWCEGMGMEQAIITSYSSTGTDWILHDVIR